MQLFTGLEYLKIDVASSFGLDKKPWADRLAWFDQNEDALMALQTKAKDPALYFAGVRAYEATKRGEASGYPISLDATASGIQILSALTGDRRAALLCNVVSSGDRENAYTVIYEKMVERAKAAGIDTSVIDAEELKRAVMTSCYGSSEVPKEVFGEGDLYEIFLETMEEEAPGVWILNKMFLELWDPKATEHNWVLPDNFHVRVKVMNTVEMGFSFLEEGFTAFRKVNEPKERGRSLGANATHSVDGMLVREMVRRCAYDPQWIQLLRDMLAGDSDHYLQAEEKKEALHLVPILWAHYQRTGFLSARILAHIDSDTIKLVDPIAIERLLASLPVKPFNVLTTHDCFRCLPNYGNDLRRQYNNLLSEIASSSLLADLLSQITGDRWDDAKLDANLAPEILETEYALS
ncbi:DNA-directed RNA polymerase [Roseococcus sp.]|uniref:DNA-directed RNA polymerase n=1 Tax=Roseococcus sp. TaxID=2109646 RepID=UPI003BA9C39A